jgi:hypothetical protein
VSDPTAAPRRIIAVVTTLGHRRALAVICVAAALAGQIALPAMHALVHALEEAVQRAHAKRWRVEGENAEEKNGHGHRHEHPGDRPGEHGANAPEHLSLAILQPEAPAIPAPAEEHQTAAPPALRSIVPATAPVRDHGIRGPPSRS